MGIFRDRPTGGSLTNALDPGVSGRKTNYYDSYVTPIGTDRYALTDEGSYFTAVTPTPGTGVVDGVVTTFVETTPSLVIYNGGSQRLYMDFIRFTLTVAPVGGTRVQFTTTIDDGNRYSSGGTALTIANANMDSVIASGVSIYKGVITATAASASRRILAHTVYRWGTIGIVGDQYELIFGQQPVSTQPPIATLSTFSKGLPPAEIGPGDSLLITQWEGSQSTAPTHAVEMGFWVR